MKNYFVFRERGYGGIGRRYGLDRIEPWYGNLLSDSFQIQGTLGYFEWAILSQIWFLGTIVLLLERDRCRDSMEAFLTDENHLTKYFYLEKALSIYA